MTRDFLTGMGATVLGSRLKRAGQAVQAASQAWLDTRDCPVPATHMPVLAVLAEEGASAVGRLAGLLGIAQPGVTRMLAQLEAGGWIVTGANEADRRVREARLTDAGETLVRRMRTELWPEIERVAAGLCAGLEGDFLDQLTALEARLEDGHMAQAFRANARLSEGGEGSHD